ncbi:MAG TPA: hypothetical protein VF974_07680 [Patescibacteria group bacterium]
MNELQEHKPKIAILKDIDKTIYDTFEHVYQTAGFSKDAPRYHACHKYGYECDLPDDKQP